MQRLFTLTTLAFLAGAAPAPAEEAVTCLQDQLAALGFDPGPADGSVGPATRAALAAYESAQGVVADRRLDAVSAIVFCRELGLRDPALLRHWPAADQRLRVEVTCPADDALRTGLLTEANAALSKLETLIGLQLAAPVDIVFGESADEIAARAKPLTPSPDGAVERFARRLCADAPDYGVSATHMPGVILICQRPGVVYHAGFPLREVRNRLGELMAMEMIAQLTGDPANGSDREYYQRTGPMWLVVGTMQLLQREVDGAITPLGRKTSIEKLRKEGVSSPRRMVYYQASLEDPVGIGRTGLLVTDDLTRESGLAPLGEFYRMLGTGATVEAAFEHAFGRSLTAVHEDYP